jgi:hypothetical protein
MVTKGTVRLITRQRHHRHGGGSMIKGCFLPARTRCESLAARAKLASRLQEKK